MQQNVLKLWNSGTLEAAAIYVLLTHWKAMRWNDCFQRGKILYFKAKLSVDQNGLRKKVKFINEQIIVLVQDKRQYCCSFYKIFNKDVFKIFYVNCLSPNNLHYPHIWICHRINLWWNVLSTTTRHTSKDIINKV